MKTIITNKKITFTAIITLAALLSMQESLSYIVDSEGTHTTTPVPTEYFDTPLFFTPQNQRYKYENSKQPFDVIQNNDTENPVTVTIHTKKCPAITMTVPAQNTQEVPNSRFCNIHNRTGVEVVVGEGAIIKPKKVELTAESVKNDGRKIVVSVKYQKIDQAMPAFKKYTIEVE